MKKIIDVTGFNKRIFPGLFVLLSAFSCSQDPEKKWFKGNLHTHSLWSDGDEYPEMIMDWYKSHGYDFVALSDHNVLAEGEKWIVVPNSKMYTEGFHNYLATFGPAWVTYKTDTGRIQVKLKTLAEYQPRFEDDDFLIFPSEEITDRFEGKPIHINATNIRQLIAPQGGASVTEVLQRNVDAVLRQRKETGVPMFPHINHPNFGWAVSIEDFIPLTGERFFEVYNGHPLVHNEGDSLHPSTETMWDAINIAYHKKGQPLLLGLATDDSHNYHQFGTAYSNAGRGWVMVQADSLDAAALITAMEKGNFYASTGVVLEDLRCQDNVLTVRVRKEKGVRYTIEVIGVRVDSDTVELLEKNETEITFRLSPDFRFIRARILSDKLKENPFRDGEVEKAWTQPVSFSQ